MKGLELNVIQQQRVRSFLQQLGIRPEGLQWHVVELKRSDSGSVLGHKIVFDDSTPDEMLKPIGGIKSFLVDIGR